MSTDRDGACPRCDLEYGHDEPCNRPVGEVPPDVDLLDRRRADGYVPTTEQVRNNMAFGAACAFVALRKPDDDLAAAMRDIDWPMPGLRVQIKAEFDQWLATHPTPDPYQALLTQLHEAKMREAALRAGIEGLDQDVALFARLERLCIDGARNPSTLADAVQDEMARTLRALLDGEVRP